MTSLSRFKRFFPFMQWFPMTGTVLKSDLIAGITVALVLIPQSMAYAQLAGLPPYYGLYAAFLPPMVASLFGSSRQLATGPVAVVSLLTAAALEPLAAAGSSGYIVYAILLSLMVGIFQLSLGLLRLGVVFNFLSHQVIVGFTNAAAIIIATSQLDKIFGVRAEKAEHHYETVWNTITAATTQTHLPTLAMALGAFTIMIVLRRYKKSWPNVLIAVAVTTVIASVSKFEHLQKAKLNQFESPAVHEVVRDEMALMQEIPEMEIAITAAETKYQDALKRNGINDSRSLQLQHDRDTLKLKHDRRVKTAKADIDELKKIRFDFVPDGTGGRFYLQGNAPEGVETDGRLWRIRKVDGEILTMNGGGNVVGTIPQGLPSIQMPKFDLGAMMELLSAAITISLLGFMEAISIAKAMATTTRQRLDANQELVGQGLANVVGSFSMSYPTSGSFSRSAVNMASGAVTGLSSVATSVVVVIALLWLTPLLYHLPQATLAAVIMMAVIGLINVKAVKHAWQANKQDGIVAVVSFTLTLVFAPHLDKGILIGAGLALGLFLYHSMKPRVAYLSRHSDGTLRDASLHKLNVCDEISMIRFDGQLYFANTAYFEDTVLERVAAKPKLKYIIVVGEGINNIDATGEEMLHLLVERLKSMGIEVYFSGLKLQILNVITRTGLYETIGEKYFFRTTDAALEAVWTKLGKKHKDTCPLRQLPVKKTAKK